MKSNLQLNESGFVLGNARVLVAESQAAYGAGNGVAGPGQGSAVIDGTADVAEAAQVGCFNQATGTHARITAYEDCTVIAFRGTASLRDWITDAEFPLRSLPGTKGRVHAGFWQAVESVLGAIQARVGGGATTGGTVVCDGKPMVLTGHSLGGALAVLAAFRLANLGYPVRAVYTFGQPRVGDRAFAEAYAARLGARTFRAVNQNDVVPRVPGVLLGYHHAGVEAFINVTGRLVLNPSLAGHLVSDALGLYRAYRRLEDVLITDHFVDRYVAALREAQRTDGKER